MSTIVYRGAGLLAPRRQSDGRQFCKHRFSLRWVGSGWKKRQKDTERWRALLDAAFQRVSLECMQDSRPDTNGKFK